MFQHSATCSTFLISVCSHSIEPFPVNTSILLLLMHFLSVIWIVSKPDVYLYEIIRIISSWKKHLPCWDISQPLSTISIRTVSRLYWRHAHKKLLHFALCWNFFKPSALNNKSQQWYRCKSVWWSPPWRKTPINLLTNSNYWRSSITGRVRCRFWLSITKSIYFWYPIR